MRMLSNKTLFRVHGWLGLNCGVVLFVICLSGTIATLSEEIDWLINPALRVSSDGERLPWDQLRERVVAQHTDAAVQSIRRLRGDATADFVEVETATGQRTTLLVNPRNGDVQGAYSLHSVKVLFRVFHKQFYIFGFPKGIHGTYLVGTYALVLLCAGLSGLIFYKRCWRRLFVLRLNKGWSTFWRDSHRFLGVWACLFLLLWGITGVWYLLEKGLHQFADYKPGRVPLVFRSEQPQSPVTKEAFPELRIRDFVEIALRELPGMEVVAVELPRQAGGPVTIAGKTDAMLVNAYASQVLIDSLTGEVISVQKAEKLRPLDRWSVMADPLHFGTFGGIVTKGFWFVFGLGLSFSIPIGATIWYRRTQRASESSLGKRSKSSKIASITFTTLVLLIAASYTFLLSPARKTATIKPIDVSAPQSIEIGPWSAEITRVGELKGDDGPTLRLAFTGADLPAMKAARIQQAESATPFKGSWQFLHADLKVALANDVKCILVIESRTGETYEQEVDVEKLMEAGELVDPTLPSTCGSPIVSLIFCGFLLFVGGFAGVWFWKIG